MLSLVTQVAKSAVKTRKAIRHGDESTTRAIERFLLLLDVATQVLGEKSLSNDDNPEMIQAFKHYLDATFET